MLSTAILIINWNNGSDTIAALQSVLHYKDTQVLLLDNASSDNSVETIKNYLEEYNIEHFVTPAGGLTKNITARVVLVLSDKNLGFAKGNNVLLHYTLDYTDAMYVWLLNNDAVADPNALPELIKVVANDDKMAFAGSVIMDFYKRDIVQCCGVKYYPYWGVSKLILKGVHWSSFDKTRIPYKAIDFQQGSSLLARVDALHTIGLMDERYFLYFEEHDWQYVAEQKGYHNTVAIGSLVYHKGSVSTNNTKHLFFYYYNRSAILYARKNSAIGILLSVLVLLTGVTVVRSKLYFKSLWWGMKGMWEGLWQSV